MDEREKARDEAWAEYLNDCPTMTNQQIAEIDFRNGFDAGYAAGEGRWVAVANHPTIQPPSEKYCTCGWCLTFYRGHKAGAAPYEAALRELVEDVEAK